MVFCRSKIVVVHTDPRVLSQTIINSVHFGSVVNDPTLALRVAGFVGEDGPAISCSNLEAFPLNWSFNSECLETVQPMAERRVEG
jgi:hypothetical protein